MIKVNFSGKRLWPLFIISLIYPTLSFLLEVRGVFLTSSAQAGAIISLLPIIALILFTNLSTVISIMAGVFYGREVLHIYQIIGMVFILTGVWGVNRFDIGENIISK